MSLLTSYLEPCGKQCGLWQINFLREYIRLLVYKMKGLFCSRYIVQRVLNYELHITQLSIIK